MFKKRREKRREAVKNVRLDETGVKTRIILLPTLALVLCLIVEGLNRGSIVKLFQFIASRPLYFLYNYLIILTSLTFSELFRRRRSVLYTICVFWIALGIAEFMVVRERTQPFTSMDVFMLKDAITLTTIYYTWPQIIAMYGSIFLSTVLLIYIVTRLPRRRQVNYALSLSTFCGFLTLCFCSYALGVHAGAFPRYYDNLVDAYDQYGFAACFTSTFGSVGVSKPSDYSTETVTDIVQEIDEEEHVFGEADNLDRPNVIYIQLESLFDVNTVIGAKYSEDPTPNFNRLSREFPSGELYVPSIGGGTANTEFEMLSGMNIDFFGAGEYPYTTILQETTCETIAYNLQALGYSATALHNHTGTFYSRNEVYSRLGFDHFVSVEYMPYVTYTEVGWAQDGIMADEILKALNASEERDFIMAITVESHGKYDEVYEYRQGDPEILELPEQINPNRFANYLRLIHETDAFLGKLIDKLEQFDEPVICVIYGDHLPSLDLTADILTTGNLYASRYIIWNNYGAKFEAPDLQAYRVSANLLKQLGISGGLITKYHQAADVADTDQTYLDNLEVLEYDLLYGDRSGYEGENPYPVMDMTMGCVPIAISNVSLRYGRILVNGSNFTECSVIQLDGTDYPTAFVNSAQIVAIVPRTTEVHEVCVVQKTADGVELSRTDAYSLDE